MTDVEAASGGVAMSNVTSVSPAGTVIVAGTGATAGSLLVSATVTPPAPAGS
ncbi:MAG TPA: hypothetical protein VE974_20970 [Thermoanaerobaculia bacterium]|nr:hypothetical protein [Thermoanaerobaculia bacterium]